MRSDASAGMAVCARSQRRHLVVISLEDADGARDARASLTNHVSLSMPLSEVGLQLPPSGQSYQSIGQLLFAIEHHPKTAAVLFEDNRAVVDHAQLFDPRGMPVRIDVFDPDIGAGTLVGGQDLAEPPESVRLGDDIRLDRRRETVKNTEGLFRKAEHPLSVQVPAPIPSDCQEVDRDKNKQGCPNREARRSTEPRFTPAQRARDRRAFNRYVEQNPRHRRRRRPEGHRAPDRERTDGYLLRRTRARLRAFRRLS